MVAKAMSKGLSTVRHPELTIRALMSAALSRGESIITTRTSVKIQMPPRESLGQLGATIKKNGNTWLLPAEHPSF